MNNRKNKVLIATFIFVFSRIQLHMCPFLETVSTYFCLMVMGRLAWFFFSLIPPVVYVLRSAIPAVLVGLLSFHPDVYGSWNCLVPIQPHRTSVVPQIIHRTGTDWMMILAPNQAPVLMPDPVRALSNCEPMPIASSRYGWYTSIQGHLLMIHSDDEAVFFHVKDQSCANSYDESDSRWPGTPLTREDLIPMSKTVIRVMNHTFVRRNA